MQGRHAHFPSLLPVAIIHFFGYKAGYWVPGYSGLRYFKSFLLKHFHCFFMECTRGMENMTPNTHGHGIHLWKRTVFKFLIWLICLHNYWVIVLLSLAGLLCQTSLIYVPYGMNQNRQWQHLPSFLSSHRLLSPFLPGTLFRAVYVEMEGMSSVSLGHSC